VAFLEVMAGLAAEFKDSRRRFTIESEEQHEFAC
jgi:hypothetical protein